MADEMGLRDWTIDLLAEPSADDCNAQTRMIFGRKRADLRVAETFRSFDRERIRHTIVHELAHLHLAAATSQAEQDIGEHLGATAYDIFWSGWLRNLEYGIDGLAGALAAHMPLIDWPE
jgi:hypothetical protein